MATTQPLPIPTALECDLADHGYRLADSTESGFDVTLEGVRFWCTDLCTCGNRLEAEGPVGKCWNCFDAAHDAELARRAS